MFNWFGRSRKVSCPVPDEVREWLETSFQWLLSEFGKVQVINRKVLRPVPEDFPVTFRQNEDDAYALLNIVARQMEVNPNKIALNFYDQHLVEFSGGPGNRVFSQQAAGEQYASGKYYGKNAAGKYEISIELAQLKDAGSLVATLAHEISHIKLLGERRIIINDEHLTDLIPIVFGLGIFNANSAFQFYATPDSWGYKRQGYLGQQTWGHALAMFAHMRGERNPEWVKYLTTNIKGDFKRSMRYLEGGIMTQAPD